MQIGDVKFSKYFNRDFHRCDKQIQIKTKQRIQLLLKETQHPLLRLHKLNGRWLGHWSINITGDYRALFILEEPTTALFVKIGTHAQLYD